MTMRNLIKQRKFAWMRDVNNSKKKDTTVMNVEGKNNTTIYLVEFMKKCETDCSRGSSSIS